MRPFRLCRHFLIISTFVSTFTIHAASQVDDAKLKSSLLGKKVFPLNVQIGHSGTTPIPNMRNGKPVEYPIKTYILTGVPDGYPETFRIEQGGIDTNVGRYWSFKNGMEFTVTSVSPGEDNLEFELSQSIDTFTGDIKIVFGQNWRSKMSTDEVLQTVAKYFPETQTVVGINANPQTVSAAILEKQTKAEQEVKITHEAAVKQWDEAVQQRNEELKLANKKKEEARVAKMEHEPKLGKPTFKETADWIKTNFDKIGPKQSSLRTTIYSLDKCVLQLKAGGDSPSLIVPLADVLSIDSGNGHIIFNTKHYGSNGFYHATDYDSNELSGRLVTAFNHAVKLCEVPAPIQKEPF